MPTKILLVDDEPDVEGMVKLKFRNEIRKGQYSFVFAENGVDALEKLKDSPDIDIVISDINMPEMDGLTLLSKLNSYNRLLKAIIVSAYGDMDNIRLAMNRGAYDFLIKPIDFKDLAVTIEKTKNDIQSMKDKIDALEKTEISLQDSIAMNHAIITAAADSIITIDKQGRIESVNPATEKMFGYSTNGIVGREITFFIEDFFKKIYLEPETNDGTYSRIVCENEEFVARRKNSTNLNIGVSVSQFKVSGKVMFALTIKDITLSKRAESLLKEYNLMLEREVEERTKDLIRVNKEKNEIIGIAVHDLKNPLSNIKMLAKVLNGEEGLGREEIKEFSNDILDMAERMFDLIKNLLDANALDQGRISIQAEYFSLSEIAVSEADSFLPAANEKNITIHFRNECEAEPQVFADKTRTLQILNNLVSNAVKYTPRGKNIYISLKNVGGRVHFLVRDEGPGIREEDMKKLFRKFSRLSSRPTGGESSTGLGLSIVKKLAEKMNCAIGCDSTPGSGSTFYVTFPTDKAEE